MLVEKKSSYSYTWYEDFNFIEFFPNFSRKATVISRRKFLKNFAELQEINELQVMLLKHIYKLFSIIYYHEDNEIHLRLSLNDTITVKANPEEFYELIQKSIKDNTNN